MLSLPKILLLLAVVAVVVLLSKSWRGRGSKPGEVGKDAADNKALDLNECAVCGNFVAVGAAGCERADCPYAV
ncbi:MAG: hypothetical protein QGF20_10030 [Alphaproteobacteria bacterium]|mgnify:CR=1 FL=1|jgi:hypothetical protein|nr:hypothetical protein [Alphaproteobacteria bacterium]